MALRKIPTLRIRSNTMVLGQSPTATSLQTLMIDEEVQSNTMNGPISALADEDKTKKRILEILESIGMSPSPDIPLSLPIQLGGSVDPSTDIASRRADVLNANGRAADVLATVDHSTRASNVFRPYAP